MARYTDSIKSISTVINFNKYSDLRVSIFVRNGGTNCMCQSDAIQCSILQLSILKWKINICLCSIGTHDEFHETLSLSLSKLRLGTKLEFFGNISRGAACHTHAETRCDNSAISNS